MEPIQAVVDEDGFEGMLNRGCVIRETGAG